ncbi:MAG TPA: hypothetical protein VFZ31_07900 [Vicinamibacterales bacterium]
MTLRWGVAPGLLAVILAGCASEPAPAPTPVERDTAVDPVVALPDAYKLEFENDYVKVVRVHYAVGAKLPEHIHPGGMTAYVYLNDNDGVIFDHAGGGERPYKRPPVKAGGARFQTSTEEHHTLENISPTPSDFIRIWYKTDWADLAVPKRPVIRRRIAVSETEYSNTATRITRPAFEPGKPLVVPVSDHPSLIVAWPSGRHQWIDAKAPASIPTGDAGTQGFVRFEFLTAPVPPTRQP